MNNLGIINLVNRSKVINHSEASVLVSGIPDQVSDLQIDLDSLQSTAPAENVISEFSCHTGQVWHNLQVRKALI